ncbi:PREDICTED: uncharacterized protein LOC108795095 [Nanorana parkeri]|uniref:uncharacterized protein LOC108795095 n=1 Tax=Nanorana parkeri TaxID=125878 RepID=UPI000854D7D6|nr:PREDICTED: uncharacterized protein LOC108795095 [Nanorana parkeri]
MPRCIVQGCPHYSGRKNSTPGVTFHMFPKNLATIKKWLLQINQNFGDVDAFARGVLEGKAGVIRICSAHFAMGCYHFVGSQKILLEDAVPTMSLGEPAVKVESAPCARIFPEKQKVEDAFHPTVFPEKQKVEDAFHPTAREMPRGIVQGCPHYSGRKNSTPGVTFHMFPKTLATIKKWLLQINQNFGDVDAFARGVLEGKAGVIRICSAHFAMGCYHFVGSQKILLEDAVPTMSLGEPAVKVESAPCARIFPEKQKVEDAFHPTVFPEKQKVEDAFHPMVFMEKQKMEDAFHPMVFTEKQKMEDAFHPMVFPEKMDMKVERAVPRMMFMEEEKTAVKVEAVRPLKPPVNRGTQAAGSIPDTEKSAVSTDGAVPPPYWAMKSLQMPILPHLQANMANSSWANNGLGVANVNPWSANTLANGGAIVGQKPEVDTAAGPKVEAAGAESHVPDALSERDSLSSATVQKEEKAVQWPEQETSGPAWKVLHDHYYKVRRAIDRSALRNGIESCYKDMDSEGELLAILQYVTSVLWRNRRKKELKTARILNQTLEIITLITGEEWVIVKKDSIHKGIHELTGEVPVKCGNVAVFFTLDEWSYMERHRQKYAETVADNGPAQRTWRVQEHWDSEEEYFSEEEEEEEAEGSPKRKSSPEWKPECDSLDSAEEEEDDAANRPRTAENGVRGECEPETSTPAPEGEGVPHDCDACGERQTSKEDLIRHKAVSHAVKRYPCPICGIQYDYKSQFIIHQRAHTGEKPFVCQECGARFGHKSSFLVHERRHKEGKTFECAKCDRRFDKRCELVKHEKTHGKKKRHKCHKCGKRYLSRSALMRHKWAHKDE